MDPRVMITRNVPRLIRSSVKRPSPFIRCQNQRLSASRASQLQPWPRPRYASTKSNGKTLFKQYPFSFSLACFFIATGAASLLYTTYIYHSYVVPLNNRFPEPVANKLRRALFYSNAEVDPKKAIEYYKQALTLAAEHQMDQFGDEVIGIKLTLAQFVESIHQYQLAIEIMEVLRADLRKWLEIVGSNEERKKDRTRILGKTVGISVKLGELYANEYIAENELAEENLVVAVDILLKERKRREDNNISEEDEGPWLSNEEMGGALESLANHYEQQNKHYLSAPLYLQAVALCPPSSCHSIVLMNNLSISLAQQLPPPVAGVPAASRSQLVASANAWATKALAIAAEIKPPARDEECDEGCAVATHNLGEFAEMEGLVEEARKKYLEAESLSRAAGFREGVKKAKEGLKRIGNGS